MATDVPIDLLRAVWEYPLYRSTHAAHMAKWHP
jgi:hypothetical protein